MAQTQDLAHAVQALSHRVLTLYKKENWCILPCLTASVIGPRLAAVVWTDGHRATPPIHTSLLSLRGHWSSRNPDLEYKVFVVLGGEAFSLFSWLILVFYYNLWSANIWKLSSGVVDLRRANTTVPEAAESVDSHPQGKAVSLLDFHYTEDSSVSHILTVA